MPSDYSGDEFRDRLDLCTDADLRRLLRLKDVLELLGFISEEELESVQEVLDDRET